MTPARTGITPAHLTLRTMKHLLLCFLFLGGYCFPRAYGGEISPSAGPTEGPKTNSGVPRIQFALTTKDFGRIKNGETVRHDFVFTNTGTATLQITDVKPGCGCTSAGSWDKTVEPGNTGKIPLQFNSSGFSGPISKSTTVTCNDPAQTNVVLHLTGNVWKPIDVSPTMAVFQIPADVQTNQTKILRVVNNLEEPVTFSNLKVGTTNFAAEFKELKPGKEFELHVTALAPFSNNIPATSVSFNTSSTQAPLVSVTAFAMVQPPVVVSPSQIYLPAGPLTDVAKTLITVASSTSARLTVSEPKLDLPGVEVNLREVQTGRVFMVETRFPVGFKLDATNHPILTFKTDHPKFPRVSVPVYQAQPPGAGTLRAAAPAARAPSANLGQPGSVTPTARAIPLRKPATTTQ